MGISKPAHVVGERVQLPRRSHASPLTPEPFQSLLAAVGLQENSIAVKVEELLLSAREDPDIDGLLGAPLTWQLTVAGEAAEPNGMTMSAYPPSYAGHRFLAEIISHAVWPPGDL